ncbi:MAG: hypothetical protein AB7F86_00800 [Bdellovibrionales bacterium]
MERKGLTLSGTGKKRGLDASYTAYGQNPVWSFEVRGTATIFVL